MMLFRELKYASHAHEGACKFTYGRFYCRSMPHIAILFEVVAVSEIRPR